MKTIPILLLLLTSLSVVAKPEFVPLPGTPEDLAAQARTNRAATPAPGTNNVTFQTTPMADSFSAQDAAAAQLEASASEERIIQVVTQAVNQAVTQAVTQAVAQVQTQAMGQAAPPAMPRPANRIPGGFGTIRNPSPSTATEATPPTAAPPGPLTRTPRRIVPTAVQSSSSDKPIEMGPAGAGTAPAASVPPPVTPPASDAAIVMPRVAATETDLNPAVSAPPPVRVVPPPMSPVSPVSDANAAVNAAAPVVIPAAPRPAPVAVAPPPTAPVPQEPAPTPGPTAVTPLPAPTSRPEHTVPAPAPAAPVEVIPAGVVRFQNAPLEQVLDYYSDMVKRTLLRPATLPTASITINTKTDLTKEEALQALDSVLGLNGIAMIPVGEKFMKVVPIAQANQEGAPLNIQAADQLAELGQYVTHVVQIKYSKPSELATVLQQFAKVPNSVFPIDGNQIIILRDYTENVKRMLEMIERIDVAVPSEFVSEVIPIKYALAADIQSALSSISGGGGGGSSSVGTTRTTGARGLAGTQNSLPPTSGGNQNRTAGGNVAGGAAGASEAQQTFAQRLQNIVQRANATGGDIQLIGPNKIIADERTNSLLVFATREDMATIRGIIDKLDVVLAQVLIEAIILDVSLGDSFNLGVTAGQRPQSVGESALGGLINNPNNQLGGANSFLSQLMQTFTTNIVDGATNITSVFSPASSISYPNSDGLNYFGRLGQSWDFTLSALAGNNNVKVLARPRIQTSHAVAANIFVGETRPYITGTYFDSGIGGSSRSQYQQTQIGISLNVLPLINTEGLVVMDIQQQVQQVGGSVQIDGNDVPITQDQSASAKVAVFNGETIVLGGFIQNQKADSKSGVPYLKDLPLLGALFRSTKTSNNRRELLVLLRPTVLPTPSIAALQPDIERKRLPGISQAESEFNQEQAKRMKKSAKKKFADPEAEYQHAQDMQDAQKRQRALDKSAEKPTEMK